MHELSPLVGLRDPVDRPEAVAALSQAHVVGAGGRDVPRGVAAVTPPWVRIVIVNFNGAACLQRAVDALARQNRADFECVVVDNASTDGSADRLVLPDRRFTLLHAGGNLGFAAGCNLGARGAATPWLAMLNPDAFAAEDWLETLRLATLARPDAAWFGSTQLCADQPLQLDGGGDNLSIFGLAWRGGHGQAAELASDNIRCFAPCAAAALYRRDVFEAVGGFAEAFFCYLEDVDLGFRLNLMGHVGLQLAGARVLHAGSAITGRGSTFTIRHSARNGVAMLVRCMPAPLLVLSLPLHVLAQLWLGVRTGTLRLRLTALAEAAAMLPALWRQRRGIQQSRRLSVWQVARLLSWNPVAISWREIVALRPPSR